MSSNAQNAENRMNDNSKDVYWCIICDKPIPEFTPVFCCNGRDCGCHGQPLDPPVCSDECFKAVFNGIGTSFEERRIAAGIKKWSQHD